MCFIIKVCIVIKYFGSLFKSNTPKDEYRRRLIGYNLYSEQYLLKLSEFCKLAMNVLILNKLYFET